MLEHERTSSRYHVSWKNDKFNASKSFWLSFSHHHCHFEPLTLLSELSLRTTTDPPTSKSTFQKGFLRRLLLNYQRLDRACKLWNAITTHAYLRLARSTVNADQLGSGLKSSDPLWQHLLPAGQPAQSSLWSPGCRPLILGAGNYQTTWSCPARWYMMKQNESILRYRDRWRNCKQRLLIIHKQAGWLESTWWYKEASTKETECIFKQSPFLIPEECSSGSLWTQNDVESVASPFEQRASTGRCKQLSHCWRPTDRSCRQVCERNNIWSITGRAEADYGPAEGSHGIAQVMYGGPASPRVWELLIVFTRSIPISS